jgi:UDP-4-amino-4-deoxy-L-arabinose-oxoglutarate aminotransferase
MPLKMGVVKSAAKQSWRHNKRPRRLIKKARAKPTRRWDLKLTPIEFAPPTLGNAEKEVVLKVMRSGWLTSGKFAENLEIEIQRLTDARAYVTSSATMALQMLLLALGVGPGWKVSFPAITYSGMVMQALIRGATVQLVDVDQNGFMLLPCCWRETPCHMVVITHLAGATAPVSAIRAQTNNSVLVEDCAHLYPGFKSDDYVAGACSQSDYSIFSFYPTKCVAAAEGGAITTRSNLPLEEVRLHGFRHGDSARYKISDERWVYDVVNVGTKANLSDISAAIALVQLKRIDELTERRRTVASWYMKRLTNSPIRVLNREARAANKHAEHLLIVRLPPNADRDAVRAELKEYKIPSSVHFPSVHLLSFWQEQLKLGRVEVVGGLENAEAYSRSALSLPLHANLAEEQVDLICKVLLSKLG